MRAPSPVRVSAAVFLALALAFGAGAFRLGFTAEGVPGPGLLPLATSLLLLPLGLRLLVAPGVLGPAEPLRGLPLSALGVLTVYALLLPRAGFVLPTLVLLFVWTRVFHGRALVAALGVAVALTGGAVLLFRIGLGVLVPLWPAV